MISLIEFINEKMFEEEMILERNEKIYPTQDKHAKFEIWTGDHCRDRQEERTVTDKEIIDAFYAAWPQLNKAFKEREFQASRSKEEAGEIMIVDARKDKQKPLTICCFLYRNRSDNKLQNPAFTVMTVYRDSGGAKQNRKERYKIFLY